MEASFWLKLALSFVVGSFWVTGSTLIAERFGSKLGGLIGGLPSTAVISLFFIGWSQSPLQASQAAIMIPIVQGINSLLVVVYLVWVKRSLTISIIAGLSTWFALTSLLVIYHLSVLWVSISGWLAFGLVSIFLVEHKLHVRSQGSMRVSYTAIQVVARALFGGTVIAFAVLAGKLGGPLFGGIFATFPAMFLSTLVITFYSGGADFSSAVAKSLLLSGIINVPLYALAVRLLYPLWGLTTGTLAAFMFSLGSGYLTYRFMRSKMT